MTCENRFWGTLAVGMLPVGMFFLTDCERDRCWGSYAEPYEQKFVEKVGPLQDAIAAYQKKNRVVPHRELLSILVPNYISHLPTPEELGVTSYSYFSGAPLPGSLKDYQQPGESDSRYWLTARIPYRERTCSFVCIFDHNKLEICLPEP